MLDNIGQITGHEPVILLMNFCAFMILALLRFQHRSIKNSFLPDQKIFVAMLDASMWQCCIESLANVWNGNHFIYNLLDDKTLGNDFDISFSNALNVLYFFLNLLISFFWAHYSFHKVYSAARIKKFYYPLLSIPLVVNVIILVASPLATSWVFTITPENVYKRGVLFWVPLVTCFGYILLGVYNIYKNNKSTLSYTMMPSVVLVVPILLGVILQTTVSGDTNLAMFITISLIGVYTRNQSESIYIDKLSGVFNRRYLNDYLLSLNENEKEKEKGKTITGIMLDMDKFKAINDNFGHSVGDDAISQVGNILRENLGKINFATRYGGDEFVIITPMLDTDSIEGLMQKLTEAANKKNASGEYPYVLEFSYGYAQFTVGKEPNYDGFMQRMDENMYKYKIAKKARWAEEERKTKQEITV